MYIYESTKCSGSSLILQRGDFEWQLWSLIFLSLNHWDEHSRPPPPDLRSAIRKGELKMPDERDQEYMHLNNTVNLWEAVSVAPRGGREITNANLHPIQALTPPENVALEGHQLRLRG